MNHRNLKKQGCGDEASKLKRRIKTLTYVYWILICLCIIIEVCIILFFIMTFSHVGRRLMSRLIALLILLISSVLVYPIKLTKYKRDNLQFELYNFESSEASFTQEDMEKIRKRLLKK